MGGVKRLFLSQTSKDSSVLISGNVISVALNFLITLILARSLSVEELGLFFTGLAFLQIVVDVADLGTNSAILNFLPGKKGKEIKEVISGSWQIKILVALALGLVIFLFASTISSLIFQNNQMTNLIKSSSIGVFGLLFIFWGQAIFQSNKRFISSAVLNTSINISRLGVVLVLLLFGGFNLYDTFFSFQVVLLIIVFYLFIRIRPFFVDPAHSLKLLRFGLPIGASFAVAAIYTKFDQIFVLRIAGDEEAGIFGLASKLAAFYIFAAAAFSSAIIPRFSTLDTSNFKVYFKKTVLATLLLSMIVIMTMLPLSFLIPTLFGDNFTSAIEIFQILSVGIVFFTLSVPLSNALVYKYKKTFFPLLMSILLAFVLLVLLNLLIPIYAGIGAAYAVLSMYIIQFVVSLIYFSLLYRKK